MNQGIFTKTCLFGCLCLVLTACALSEEKRQAQLEQEREEAFLASLEELTESKRIVRLAGHRSLSQFEGPTQVIGSAPILDPKNYQGPVYFLEGAEELQLQNPYFDYPVIYNERVQVWIDYFTTEGRGRGHFQRYVERSGRYGALFGAILEQQGLPRDMIFLAMAESGFQNKARSWARAVGPWQFMSFTGRRFGLTVDWYLDERRDPIKSTIAAAEYLSSLYEEFGSWELAQAGYNAGEGRIRRAIAHFGTDDFWHIRRHNHLMRETREYVPKIMALTIIGKNLQTFGFTEIEFDQPLDFEEIAVGPFTDLFKLAEALGLEFEVIQRYNPEIARWFTPPHREEYLLRIPVGYGQVWADCCLSDQDKLKSLYATDFRPYSIRGASATLADVARRFRINDPSVLATINGMNPSQRLTRGQTVYLPFRRGQTGRERMYVDLYERTRRQVLANREYQQMIDRGRNRGEMIRNPTEFYVVQSGDSLWTVARRKGVDINTLIASNLNILDNRMIRPGDRLAIR